MSLSVYSKVNTIANSFRSSIAKRSGSSQQGKSGIRDQSIGNRGETLTPNALSLTLKKTPEDYSLIPIRNPLRRACQEFEALFTAYLLKSMRRTVSLEASLGSPSARKSGHTHGWGDSFSRDVYSSMMDEEVAAYVARGPGIGLAEALYRQLNNSNP